MTKPEAADNKPKGLTLEPGTYAWCACGKSSKQPFCDGSHKGTEFKPRRFEIDEEKKVFLCMCKQTKNPPFCDGSHKDIDE